MRSILLIATLLFSMNSYAFFFGPNCKKLKPAISQTGKYQPSRNQTFSYFANRNIAKRACKYNSPSNSRFSGTYVSYACGLKLVQCNFDRNRGR